FIEGDGIGPEVVNAAVRIVEAAHVKITWERCLAGEQVFLAGNRTGVPKETFESIERTGVALKGPLMTPVGYGAKSANVTLRKMFELYGNIRPAQELPGVRSPFSGALVDLVVVRENVEDLYAGIEHMQTPGVAQGLKIMSRKGCEKVIRLAFELARAEGRELVHCATKANIMKLTEGLMKRTFEEVAPDYPDIRSEHIIIDNCAHLLVRFPEQFDVIVTSNMNGDILSDLTSGLAGGLGFAPSANIGSTVRMFEAVHGSAPNIAGKNIANPTAMVLSAVMMLRHLGEFVAATMIEHAIYVTLEEGQSVTVDVRPDVAASTDQFTDAVIGNLGRTSRRMFGHEYTPLNLSVVDDRPDLVRPATRRDVGVDIFIETADDANTIAATMQALIADLPLTLTSIANRGIQAWPPPEGRLDFVDNWPCRFMSTSASGELDDAAVTQLLSRVTEKYRWMHVEKLAEFDGERAYSVAQGEA
ncbi:MAG: NADP-dependent isocitrate dehydrogenase, partial [Phycisphaerales bacterium]|nr:NADP-dependent isocitrate dehydrogenase [Phycisphaerales bacterium]